MKKITMVMALLCAITVFGQQRVPQHVQQLIDAHTTFVPVAPLDRSARQNDAKVAEAVSNATLATLNTTLTKDIQQHRYAAIELSLPYNGSTITMQLYRTELVADGFHVDTDKERGIDFIPGAYYRGMVKGDPNSIASFSFFNKEMNGIVSSQLLGGNIVAGKLLKPGNVNDYVIYNDINLNGTSSFECGVTESKVLPDFTPKTGKSIQSVQSARCVTVYFEIGYTLFLLNGSDTTATSNWITSVFNNTQTLYENDGISTALKSVYIWTEDDPYQGDSSGAYLNEFNTQRPVFDGDVGQLVGVDEGGLGGLAAAIDGLCSDSNISYADIDFGYFQVPSYSWTVEVVTHELGHLLGSPHTHGCYWNGNNTAIDGCGTTAGFVEGSCDIGPIPSAKGTIMSYCHLVGGVGINFANGFGPQPTQRIITAVESSTCLSTDCINTCINTVSKISVIEAGTNSLTLSWDDAANSGPWQIGYNAGASIILNWQTVTENTFTLTGLNPNTYYRVGIRPLCGAGVSAMQQIITTATAADWCSGVTFRDSGNNSNYPNNQHMVRIIKPDAAGQFATVTFNSFATELDADILNVYDSAGVNPAALIGAYSGGEIPGPFQATNADGALTFEFTSDGGVPQAGWDATVGCTTTAGTKDNTFASLSYYPNPVNGSLTITAGSGITHVAVYNVAGQLLVQKNVSGNTDVTDMSAYANGVYFFKVSNGESQATLRIIKQ